MALTETVTYNCIGFLFKGERGRHQALPAKRNKHTASIAPFSLSPFFPTVIRQRNLGLTSASD